MANPDDPLLEAVCAEIAPYQWRGFTPELLARFVIAAHDRQGLQRGLAAVSGVAVGTWERLVPADADDGRVVHLVEFLATHPWAELTLPKLCRYLLGLLST